MRLSKIKLAGFKSFVDPTTITFPSSLVGVVGPNGCGKSNVIDAVRWVMGENSASRLRGDSITDVIFNGSSSRQPVGAASVELLFDNSETTLEGQYAKYSEIAIRREVSRDGISNYFLNGTRCRRKDITGVFLGTGLGPRSYSIIEQGMISRLIEAKPEDMRVFLEEAAGISKYKERRRETSNRIRNTKENLDRLRDVLEEVEKQIKHLDRQAKTAERYGRYKGEERRAAAELLALRAQDLEAQAAAADRRLADQRTQLELSIAEQRKLEASIEEARLRQTERNDAFNQVQGRYYKVGSEIARLEQSIEHAHEMRERQTNDIEQARQGALEILEHIEKDQTEIAQLELTLTELVPGLEQAKQSELASNESLLSVEKSLAEWQSQWDDCSVRFNDAQQQQRVEQTRAEQIESRLRNIAERLKKLDDAQSSASTEELKTDYEQLIVEEQRKRQARETFDQHLTEITDNIRNLRDNDNKLTRLVDERKATLQDAQGKYASLEALQKAALGQGDSDIQSWLEGAGLDKNKRVAQSLDVSEGWERAVETVLGSYLQAVCIRDIFAVTENISGLRSGDLIMLEHDEEHRVNAAEQTLAAKVNGAPAEIWHRLSDVRIADSMSAALAIRESLGEHQSVITADGIWLGKRWLRVARDKDTEAGILSREQDMRRLKAEVHELQARFDGSRKLFEDGRSRLKEFEDRREAVQNDAASLFGEYSEIKAALDAAKYRMDQANARQVSIAEESSELGNDQITAEEQIRESRRRFDQATDMLAVLETERAALESRRTDLRSELQRVREQADADRQAVQSITIQFESRRTSKDSAAQSLLRMQSQLQQFKSRETDGFMLSSSLQQHANW
jgi:chromosome segregation protein